MLISRKSSVGHALNPMAVELCKVSLWMEAVEPGLPLSFLDSHIQHGNALLGTTPELMAKGIPDAAWDPIEGDDKKTASALKKRNKAERMSPNLSFEFSTVAEGATVAILSRVQALDLAPDARASEIANKEQTWRQILASGEFLGRRLAADVWCAAFVWPKQPGDLAEVAPTHAEWERLRHTPEGVSLRLAAEVARLAGEYRFFHWHLAFPQVFARGGFDVVLGNPPWEHVELKEQEWFAERSPEISNAPNAAARKRMIGDLKVTNLSLYLEFSSALRRFSADNHLARASERFPLCAKGRINTYALFAEHNRAVLGPSGRAGFIVPTGIATDDTTKEYFGGLVERNELASLFSFENMDGVFPAVHRSFNFALLTVDRSGGSDRADLVFFARQISALREPGRHLSLSPADFATLNPNTRTCPTFRSRRDADINLSIYRRTGVLWREDHSENPWGLRFMQGIFNMAADSGLFRTRSDLEGGGHHLVGNRFDGKGGSYVPLIEAKMVHHYDHRFGTYEGQTGAQDNQGKLPEFDATAHADAQRLTHPYYWVARSEVDDRLRGRWDRGWLLGWRDICRSTDQRTVIASLIPKAATGDTFLLGMPGVEAPLVTALYANLSSFCLDYAARQKVGGTHLKYHTFKQLPVLPPTNYTAAPPWSPPSPCATWLLPRVLELTYTAWDLAPFAHDVGYDGPPFRWDPARRFLLRAELDAAFFHLYGISHDDADYILDTFPIVRKHDEKAHGEYRTKRVILEIYDAMAEATRTARPYQTRLDPPPADPRIAHPDTRQTKS